MKTALVLLLLSPLCAQAAGDGLLTEAERQAAALEAVAGLASSAQGAGNGGWVSPADAAAYCAASPMTLASLTVRERVLLSACSAFAAGDPALCRKTPAAFVSRNAVTDCEGSLEHMSLFVDLLAPGPAALRSCQAGFGLANPPLTPDQRGPACAALAKPGDATVRCKALSDAVPAAFTGAHLEDCTRHVDYLLTGHGCDGFHPASDQRVLCGSFAAFRTGDCGSDYLCRVLKGDPAACGQERAARAAAECAKALPTAGPRTPAAPPAPALRRAIEETVAWAAGLTVLDPEGRAALDDLHLMMLGKKLLEPRTAVADMARLRSGSLDEILHRAELLAHGDDDLKKIQDLRRRAAAASPSPPAPGWTEVDGRLSELKEAHVSLAACVKDKEKMESGAVAPLTLDQLLTEPRLKRRLSAELVLRQVCVAHGLGNDGPCDALSDVPGSPETGQRMCRRLFAMTRFSRALLARGTETAAECADWCRLAPSLPPQDLIDHVCGSLRSGDVPGACSAIAGWKSPGEGYNLRECGWEMESVLGLGTQDSCRKSYRDGIAEAHRPGRDICVATGLYHKAKDAGDVSLCGQDAVCRAMMGEAPGACAPLDREILAAAAPLEMPGDRLAALDLRCAAVRTAAVKKLDETKALLDAPARRGDPGLAPRQASFAALEKRQRSLETAFLSRRKGPPAANASYSGGWSLFNKPEALAGCCGTPGPDAMKERLAGSLQVDGAGHFILFSRRAALVGDIDPATGRLSGTLDDPFCGNGTLSGTCTSAGGCTGNYSQSSASSDGTKNSESGTLRLSR